MDFDRVVLWVGIVLLTLIVVGTVLLYPVSRRLAHLIDWHLEEKKKAGVVDTREGSQVIEKVAALEQQVTSVTEKQRFLESLLEGRQAHGPISSGEAHREHSPLEDDAS